MWNDEVNRRIWPSGKRTTSAMADAMDGYRRAQRTGERCRARYGITGRTVTGCEDRAVAPESSVTTSVTR